MIIHASTHSVDSLVAQMVKSLPALKETWDQSLGSSRSPENGNGNILAWKIPWMEEHGGLQSIGGKESDTPERLPFYFLHKV